MLYTRPTSVALGGGIKFIYLHNHAIAESSPAGTKYDHTDGLGSPVAWTDSKGAVLERTAYEPFGLTTAGAVPTLGYAGHMNAVNIGMIYMQQRYYDPVAGRMLSIDPVITDANTGGSFNRYAYANNSPYKYIDPDGRDEEKVYGAGAGIALRDHSQRDKDLWKGGEAAATTQGGSATNGFEMSTGILDALKTSPVAARATQVQAALDPIAASRRTTAVVQTTDGKVVIGAGGRDLSPAQRAEAKSGESLARLPKAHAEMTVLDNVARNGGSPSAIAASRPFCDFCSSTIVNSGGRITSPSTAVWDDAWK